MAKKDRRRDSYRDERYEDSYQDDGYREDGYQDDGYQDDGYTDYGYDDQGYDDQGYDDQGYDDYGYDDREYDEGYGEPAGRRSSSGGKSSRKKNGRKKRTNAGVVAATVLLLVVLVGAFGLKVFLDKYSYSKETADLNEYFSIADESDVPIVWGDELSEVRAKLIDGGYYMSLSDVQANLNSRFYYGVQNDSDETGMIIYCLPTDKAVAQIGSSDVTTSAGTDTKDYVPAVRQDDTVYLNLEWVKEYTNFSMEAFSDPARLQIVNNWDNKETVATVKKNTQIRVSGGIKSDVLEQIAKGSQVTILDQMDDWSQVKSGDAMIGYIENKRLENIQEVTPTPVTDYTEPEFTRNLHGTATKINMPFHAVFDVSGNDAVYTDTANVKNINTIAPTWFWVNDNAGDITSQARQDYVDYAHAQGWEVWAVVDNFNSTSLPDHDTFLKSLDSRTNLITQLMNQAQAFGIDGINVDFEQISEDNGQNYIEFVRELSIACRNAGLTLSVDDYVPYEYNDFYHLEEQGVFADYVVIMGYDEHTSDIGSNASISYVTDGLKYATEKVDKSRVINAIPFYSNFWVTRSTGQIERQLMGMQETEAYISENNVTLNWNAEIGQNYGELTKDDNFVQVYVEDEQSIKLKLDAMASAGIGGVAEWKLEFDTPEVWDAISAYMQQ